jgi:hypothetical protein
VRLAWSAGFCGVFAGSAHGRSLAEASGVGNEALGRFGLSGSPHRAHVPFQKAAGWRVGSAEVCKRHVDRDGWFWGNGATSDELRNRADAERVDDENKEEGPEKEAMLRLAVAGLRRFRGARCRGFGMAGLGRVVHVETIAAPCRCGEGQVRGKKEREF